MADIKRTLSELLIDYADNSVGAITPSKLRNGFKSVFGSTDVYIITSGATYNATADNVVMIYNYPFSQGYVLLPAVSSTDTSGYTYAQKEYVISNASQFNLGIVDLKDASTLLNLGPGDYAYIAANTSAWNVVSKFITSGFVKTDGSNIMTGKLKTPAVSATLIEFNTDVSEIPLSAGQVRWNPLEKTFDFGLTDDIVGQLFEEFFVPAHNETGSTILNGTVVYLTSGNDNDQLHVGVASKDSINAKSSIAVATFDVTDGTYAKFTKIGKVRDVNTSQCLPGRKIFLGLNGAFTSAEAVYPDYNIQIGYCVIQHATSGIIYVDIRQENSIEDIYNVSLTNPQAGDSFIYENKRWINRNFGEITGEPTGFETPDSVYVYYDSSARTITLTGSNINAYWRSNLTPISGTSWTSAPHASGVNVPMHLYYNGTSAVWTSSMWPFSAAQIAYVAYDANGTYQMALRECHGTMPWQAHKEFHQTIGCYLSNGGDLSSYKLNSTASADRRPNISSTTINDEDLETTNPSLTSKLYSLISLSGADVRNFTRNYSDIILNNGAGRPYYNQYNGSAWVQTLFPSGDYGCIFVIAAPAAADTKSQELRYIFVQPQGIQTSLALAQGVTSNSVNLGNLATLAPEFAFISRIIIRYTGGNWQLIQVDKLTGTKTTQTSTIGAYLSQVSHDSTLSGAGTVLSPLGVTMALGALTNVNAQSAINGNALIYVSAANQWQPYGNTYAWEDATQKFYNKEIKWDTASTIVSANSAAWDAKVGSYTSAQSSYLVSAVSVVSAMPLPANRVPNVLYFLLS